MKKRTKCFLGILISLLLLLTVGCAVGDPLRDDFYVTDIYGDDAYFNTINVGGVPIGAEVDPIFTASPAFGITLVNIATWNSLVSSQWVTDANGIHYSAGNIGVNTNSSATGLLALYSNDGVSNDPVLSVVDNSASGESVGIRVNMIGAKTDYSDGIYITNQTTSNAPGEDKYGLRIKNTGAWTGAGSVNYGLYIEPPTGGTTNIAAHIEGDSTLDGSIDWVAGNVIFVPLAGNIQAYVNNATAGDTLILASGRYVITSTITINKQLNIMGQGNAGFATTPVTPSHGTIIACATDNVTALQIDNDNIRIAHLSIDMTGDNSMAINTDENLNGLVFTNIDVIVNCDGTAQAFTIDSSNAVLRDLTFFVTSSDNTSSGVLVYNNSTTTQNAIIDAFSVTGTVQGGATSAYAFGCWNNNSANTITLNLIDSLGSTLAGTPIDAALVSYSLTTNNSIINSYLSTFNGADYDAYQTGTNQLNLGGSVLENGLVFGTVTYRATMTSANLVVSGNINFAGLPIFANNAAAVAGGLVVGDLYRTNGDPDLLCVVH